jgi:hypothetical protein
MSWQRLDEFGGIQDQVWWTCLVFSIAKDFRFGRLGNLNAETLSIVENQNTQKEEYKEQNGRTCPKRQMNHLSKRVHHKGNIKFLNLLPSREAYQIRKREDFLKGHLT